jgi:hypothetical protein
MESHSNFNKFINNQPAFQWFAGSFKSHPTLIISLIYFIASVWGMLYEVFLLLEFRIYAFHYSRIYEFFLSAFKAYEVSIVSILCVLLILYFFFHLSKIKRERKIKRFFLKGAITIIILLMFLFPYIYAALRADYLRTAPQKIVSVVVKTDNTVYSAEFFKSEVVLISSSENFLYLYHRNSKKSFVIPISNILLIEYD